MQYSPAIQSTDWRDPFPKYFKNFPSLEKKPFHKARWKFNIDKDKRKKLVNSDKNSRLIDRS